MTSALPPTADILAWGDFYHPMDIAEDDRGMILVTDQVPRLSMLSPAGELVGRCRAVWNGWQRLNENFIMWHKNQVPPRLGPLRG